MSGLDIVIPCKAFASGKSRLAPLLTPQQRADLCRAFLERTVLRAKAFVAAPSVASDDPDVLATASGLGARSLAVPGKSLNDDLAAANASLGLTDNRLLILPIDLPLATPAALRCALLSERAMTLAPDATGAGTNLLLLGAGLRRTFEFHYGPDSRRRHEAEAARRDSDATILCDARLAFDIDEPADYARWTGDANPPTPRRTPETAKSP